MYKTIVSMLFCVFGFVCSFGYGDSPVVQYQISDNQYAVTVPEDGITQKEAKKIALQKAAEVYVANGYRYFTIESANEVSLLKSTPPARNGPTDLYYEMIQSNNFGRQPVDVTPNVGPATVTKGWRLQFACYVEKPSKKAIDACQYTDCP